MTPRSFLLLCRYASRAKNIKNHARINEDPKDAMLREFQKEIEQLKRQLENSELNVVCVLCDMCVCAASGSGSESGEETKEAAKKKKKSNKRCGIFTILPYLSQASNIFLRRLWSIVPTFYDSS